MTDIRIEDKRIITTSKLEKTIYSVYILLEGRKKFLKERTGLSFENTPHNLEIWKKYYPNAKIDDVTTLSQAMEAFTPTEQRPVFKFKTEPYAHQLTGFNKLKDSKSFALFAEMGLGKSKILIDIIGYKWCINEIDAVIILSPKGVHSQWAESQFPEHMSEVVRYRAWVWDKSPKELERHKSLFDFDGLRIVTMNLDAIKTDSGNKLLKEFIKFHKGRVLIAVDESHGIKTFGSARTKKAIELGGMCEVRGILTGSPIAKNVVDLFSQFKFLDERILGFRYLKPFTAQYCVTRWNGFGNEIIGAKNLEQLYKKIDKYTLRATKDELDLPPKMYDQYVFELTEEQKKAYKELKTKFLTQLAEDTEVSVTNAISALTRLQQITSGYLPNEDGETFEFPKNPRLEALDSVIENIEGKIIIWSRFTHDVELITKHLGKEAVSYYGGTSDKDRKIAIEKFLDKDSGVRFFVANPAAAASGLNLQGLCTTCIYYANDYNAINRWQSEDRIHRVGTRGTCTYIDLVAKGSADKKIIANLKEKKSLSDLALDDVRKLIEEL